MRKKLKQKERIAQHESNVVMVIQNKCGSTGQRDDTQTQWERSPNKLLHHTHKSTFPRRQITLRLATVILCLIDTKIYINILSFKYSYLYYEKWETKFFNIKNNPSLLLPNMKVDKHYLISKHVPREGHFGFSSLSIHHHN